MGQPMSAGKAGEQHDDALPGLDTTAQLQGQPGYLQTQVTQAVNAAALDDRDKGMGALAVACARAVDLAHYRRDPYAVASAARELRETLVRLRMDPASRMGQDAGGVEAWLQQLGAE